MAKRKIVLASKSPRRKRMLEQIGVDFEIRESTYKEDMSARTDPYELAKFLALKKAEAVAGDFADAIIISADTFTIFNGEYIGKPKDKDDAKRILKNFSGQEHKIISAFALIDTKNQKVINDLGEAVVKFRNLSDEEIDAYVASGEPLEMAGGYGMLDHGATLIESVSGDFFSVIGLPLTKIYLALKEMGAI